MPRYVVERSFPEGLGLPLSAGGRRKLSSIIQCNSDRNVTWVRSYVTTEPDKTFCIYEAPNPEAVRLAATSNDLPVDRIIEVSLLDPYAYNTA